MHKTGTLRRRPASSAAFLARKANVFLAYYFPLGRTPQASRAPNLCTWPYLDEEEAEKTENEYLAFQALELRKQEQSGQGWRGGRGPRISLRQDGPHQRGRLRSTHLKWLDFAPGSLAHQLHNAKSLHETLGREKKSVKYLDDLPTWRSCRWQQRFIKQARKQDVIKQFESMPS